MGSWEEALDIDDSDLPSLIRPSLSQTLLPCKRSHLSTTLKHCSQLPTPSQPPNPLTLDSQSPQSQPLLHQSPNPKDSAPSASSKPHTIPGPAGVVQAAMRRKSLNDQSNKDNIPSTQEYITRAMQGDGIDPEDDDDFKQNPWLCGMKSVEPSFGLISKLGSIKNCHNTDRLSEVVVIVKSCSPNGLGDLNVTLKDTTGTIGAYIHHKVLMESDFRKDISVGSVLMLRNVAVFSPSPSAQYLNITLKNVWKVIIKDSGPPSSNIPVRAATGVTDERIISNEGITKNNETLFARMFPSTKSCQHGEEEEDEEDDKENNESQSLNLSMKSSVMKNGGETQRPQTLPQWTDEQLAELFAASDDW